jgi:hypothetical protein
MQTSRNVVHQIGSASGTPGGKFLLVGPDWQGQKPEGFIDILRVPTNYAGAFARSFAPRTPEGKARPIAVLNETGMYTMTFAKEALPPVDRSRGGFWSQTMYDKDYFMLPKSPNGRTNIGTVSLDGNQLQFAPDGSLTIHISRDDPTSTNVRANWLPAPDEQFALIVRAYVPTQQFLAGSYRLPNVERWQEGAAGHALQ